MLIDIKLILYNVLIGLDRVFREVPHLHKGTSSKGTHGHGRVLEPAKGGSRRYEGKQTERSVAFIIEL